MAKAHALSSDAVSSEAIVSCNCCNVQRDSCSAIHLVTQDENILAVREDSQGKGPKAAAAGGGSIMVGARQGMQVGVRLPAHAAT